MNKVKLVQEYERENDVNVITDFRNMFTNTFPAIRICFSIFTTLVLYFFGTGSFAKTLENLEIWEAKILRLCVYVIKI